MKLSAYAEKLGISDKTAWRWWKEGKLDAYQTEPGTVIVREPIDAPAGIALYARVSSADQKDDLVRQLERLQTYAIAKGYQRLYDEQDRDGGGVRAESEQAETDRPAQGGLDWRHRG
jgi:predicted site-specific integrase-resolvase